jgi:hypothetical protein
MLGAVIIVVVIVIALPVALMMSGGAFAAVLGWVLKDNGERTHEGSELIELNR